MELSTAYDALGLPAGAHLVSDHGEVTLIQVQHEHEDDVRIARYRLGAAVEVPTAIKLFDSLGLMREPATDVATPLEPAPAIAPGSSCCGAIGAQRIVACRATVCVRRDAYRGRGGEPSIAGVRSRRPRKTLRLNPSRQRSS